MSHLSPNPTYLCALHPYACPFLHLEGYIFGDKTWCSWSTSSQALEVAGQISSGPKKKSLFSFVLLSFLCGEGGENSSGLLHVPRYLVRGWWLP